MKSPSTELVPVPFYGDTMLATQHQGKTLTSLKRICENIGVDFDSQRKKLNGYKWASTALITVQVGGQRRKILMIDTRSLPMWLVTIHPSKVAFDVRDKLERYQMEAAEVLANFYMGEKKGDNLPAIKRKLDKLAEDNKIILEENKRIEFYAGIWRTKAKQNREEIRDLQNQVDLLMDPPVVRFQLEPDSGGTRRRRQFALDCGRCLPRPGNHPRRACHESARRGRKGCAHYAHPWRKAGTDNS